MIEFSPTVFALICFTVVIIAFIAISFNQNEMNKIKESLKQLETQLAQEDQKINENFEKIHRDIGIVEREVNHALTKTVYKKKAYTYKQMGKKAQKFLTPKGKIKKAYLNNPLAHQYYQKFHRLQEI